jgi:hypothetical protein
MRHAAPGEYLAYAIAALVLIIVLVASFMCVQLFDLRKAPAAPASDSFVGGHPGCGAAWEPWAARARGCHRGFKATAGAMPAIERSTWEQTPGDLCCGRLGIPP